VRDEDATFYTRQWRKTDEHGDCDRGKRQGHHKRGSRALPISSNPIAVN
jgi:hypothetical protein